VARQGGVASVSQVDFGPGTAGSFPGDYGFRNALAWNQSTAGTGGNHNISQVIENVSLFDGLTVTLSFWIICSVSFSLPVSLTQWSGTATISTVSTTVAITANTWKKVKVTFALPAIPNATVLSAGNGLILNIQPPIATVNATYLTGVQLDRGQVPAPFRWESFETTLRRCMRYFQKSFPYATAPASNAGVVNASRAVTIVAGVNTVSGQQPYAVPMRAAPTLTFYNPSAAGSQARNNSIGTDCTSTTVSGSTGSSILNWQANTDATTGVNQSILAHWTATAEI
jgi:hypothetical protein